MYSLTIHFGPSAMVRSLLFKEKEKADSAFNTADCAIVDGNVAFRVEDDFGQIAVFAAGAATGIMLEDTEQVMEARIFRSLDNARGEIKAKQRAATDPVIRSAQQGPSVIAPNFRAQ
jgi:hypothetical protein